MPRPTNLSLELLETFATLVKLDGDASQAARELSINQPSMSKRLAHLQHTGKVLKRPWLERDGKTWLLTDEGRRVWPVVQGLLERYRQLVEFSTAGAASTVLRFSCGQTATARLVRVALSRFQKSNPDAKLRISTMRNPDRITGVASGALDMALVTAEQPEIERLARVPLHIENIEEAKMLLVCSPDSPSVGRFHELASKVEERSGNHVTVKELQNLPLIGPEPDSDPRVEIANAVRGKAWGRNVTFNLEVGGWLSIIEYVKEGHGIGIVSEGAIERGGDMLTLDLDPRVFRPSITRFICRLSPDQPDGIELTESGRAWRDTIRRVAEGN